MKKVIDCKAEAETCVLETCWADNTFMQAENAGVGYRLSKDLDNRDSELAPWGCLIEGIDCKDGWLAVEHRFLPIVIRGAQVLFRGGDLRCEGAVTPTCTTQTVDFMGGALREQGKDPSQLKLTERRRQSILLPWTLWRSSRR